MVLQDSNIATQRYNLLVFWFRDSHTLKRFQNNDLIIDYS